jgi:hypothetical protein
VGIVRVDNERDTLTDKGVGDRIYLYQRCIRYLLDTGYYLHKKTSTMNWNWIIIEYTPIGNRIAA